MSEVEPGHVDERMEMHCKEEKSEGKTGYPATT